jgi:hypothetical protein
MAENTGRKQNPAAFKPGQSGNPKGRPRGARSRTTVAVEALLEGQAERLTQKAVELALAGNVVALRLCLERIAPPMRERPVHLDAPASSLQDLPQAMAELLGAVASGELTPGEAERVARVAGVYVQALEAQEFEARLSALEEQTPDPKQRR